MNKSYYIGLMSGTSMDGVDAVLVKFTADTPTLVEYHSEAIPAPLLNNLQKLCLPGNDEINRLGHLDRAVGKLFAKAVNNLLEKAGVDKLAVIAIGSHGQTVRHMPNLEMGFTLQIGDPNTIAAETDIDVIADFRRKDIALGGQGAPLVPAFHQHVFAMPNHKRIILNIGGIANITYLPGNTDAVTGFDTGPGNTLIDAWIQHQQDLPYDKEGAWAKAGTTDEKMLQHLLSHPYFSLAAPKSTGRELFNQAWLEQQLAEFNYLSAADIQSTLLDLTCYSIANDALALATEAEMYVCGGGAYNTELMCRLQKLLPNYKIVTTAELGINPQWVEGIAFAWLAMRFHLGLPGNLPAVTGASRAAILGGKFYAL
ncbi:anhydro-N-acetylmuramic acid kinase [Shewanella sp. Choline-02u-19]|jgi:anhydro-N-acetylmuramic acid kinase|uniref:anhydro-N-acetylmuramic acid kinase n=1 Tax=unclassified Shewanella TaxID=196818 RepID=UPI000C34BCF0|nr:MULTISPECIES: anhydro-N-acetylmuramic acid kinase [unclassified Shewanella]PKG56664.1 anhydro-N-acetylmuramic acid kinase [Shewanella sp. GutDb-MelDb]PKG76806.1 anhydro-N-acetylmuramic acid kinase [Shewanella sp. GutCb]PKH57628.1 anhydro-N-acetylmuramic acid kinase [Shewanella sp. Bg11-22]PKI28490.1 anhydro-N-acetylmuramic acid kinase [Shewanella sp. Choline-02u-19]